MVRNDTSQLVAAVRLGNQDAFADLFDRYRPRFKRMITLRLDRRLYGRVDPDDVIQESFLDALAKLPRYLEEDFPPYLWFRLIVGEKLTQLHRHHLGVQMRDADREVSIYRGSMPTASSVALAGQLVGKITSPSQAAVRAELTLQIQEALNQMDPIDREILTLRNFESLTNTETAQVLELTPQAASNRYIRALKRLKKLLVLVRDNVTRPGDKS